MSRVPCYVQGALVLSRGPFVGTALLSSRAGDWDSLFCSFFLDSGFGFPTLN